MRNDLDPVNKEEWEQRVQSLFRGSKPRNAEWNTPVEIVRILNHFSGKGINHTMLPAGGGIDIIRAQYSKESACIELCPRPKTAYVCKPDKLEFGYFEESPWNSFLLLSTKLLEPTDTYEHLSDNMEELLELPDGEYLPRGLYDAGYIGHDEDGDEIPVPSESRVVCRFLNGKFLMVARTSYWNRVSSTYDGRHSKMDAEKIRDLIHGAIKAEKPSGSAIFNPSLQPR